MSENEKPQLVIMKILEGLGPLNALVKNIVAQTGTDDPIEAVRLVNSGRYVVVPRGQGVVKFDPVAFIDKGWSLYGENQLPLAPADIDLEMVEFVGVMKEGEPSITGHERDERLRGLGRLHLGPEHFLHCWETRDILPESLKKIDIITFDARKFRSPGREPCVLCLYWNGDQWGWRCRWLVDGFYSHCQSAVARK